MRALCTRGTQPCSGTHSHFSISEQRAPPHISSAPLQLDPTSALLKPNAKKGRLNELKWTHFQSLQLETEAFTIFHAVLFNVGGRSPFSTETFAFPFSQCLFFFQQAACFMPQRSFGSLTRDQTVRGTKYLTFPEQWLHTDHPRDSPLKIIKKGFLLQNPSTHLQPCHLESQDTKQM